MIILNDVNKIKLKIGPYKLDAELNFINWIEISIQFKILDIPYFKIFDWRDLIHKKIKIHDLEYRITDLMILDGTNFKIFAKSNDDLKLKSLVKCKKSLVKCK